MKSVYLQRIMKKNAAKGYEKTKPKQTQFPKWPKMNVSLNTTKDYGNFRLYGRRKNKPKQTQFQTRPSTYTCTRVFCAGRRVAEY